MSSFVVACLAYRGRRRSGRTPTLYVSGGFVFVGAGEIREGLVSRILGTPIASAALVQAVVVSSGMVPSGMVLELLSLVR